LIAIASGCSNNLGRVYKRTKHGAHEIFPSSWILDKSKLSSTQAPCQTFYNNYLQLNLQNLFYALKKYLTGDSKQISLFFFKKKGLKGPALI
jgi:hypothetical protein